MAMSVRYKLISKMILTVVFGLLTIIALYGATIYVPWAFRIFSEWSQISVIPPQYVAAAKWNVLTIFCVAIVSVVLTFIFGGLTVRYAKLWRKF